MLVVYSGISSMSYKGKDYKPGEKLEVSELFFKKHRSRLVAVSSDVIEGEFKEVSDGKNKSDDLKSTETKTSKEKDKKAK